MFKKCGVPTESKCKNQYSLFTTAQTQVDHAKKVTSRSDITYADLIKLVEMMINGYTDDEVCSKITSLLLILVSEKIDILVVVSMVSPNYA